MESDRQDPAAALGSLFRGRRRERVIYYTTWCRRKGEKAWTHMGTPDSTTAEEWFEKWATDPAFEYRLDKKIVLEMSVVVSP